MANDKEETMGSKRGFRQASAWVCVAAGIVFSGSVYADAGGATDFPFSSVASSGGDSGVDSGSGNSSGSNSGATGGNSTGTTQTAPPGIQTPDQSSQPPYVVNSQNGKIYPKINGGIINPSGGQFYPDVGAGYMNPATGQIIPKQ